nr:50S rRNA methyltransferase [Leuconostoc sp.]
MLKKIDKGALFLADQQQLFRCPNCHGKMTQKDKSLVCEKGHRFDLSKKGTLYFLAHQIKT